MDQETSNTKFEQPQFEDILVSVPNDLPTWKNSTTQQKFQIILYQIAIKMPVAIVIMLIPTIFIIYLLFYIVPQIGDSDDTPEIYFWHSNSEKKQAKVKAWLLFIIFSIVAMLLILSLQKAIFTQPGTIPDEKCWELDSEWSQESSPNDASERRKDGLSRSCYTCQKYKPDRTHHCRVCQTCIVKMDHHCHWISNCVGYFNYKYFFQTVGYAVIELTIFSATFWEAVVVNINDDDVAFGISFSILVIYSLMVLLNLAVLGFWIFHWYLVLWGFTTLEFCEKRTKGDLYKDGSPYSFGLITNMKQAFGNNYFLWPVPFGRYRDVGDQGILFKRKDKEQTQEEQAIVEGQNQ